MNSYYYHLKNIFKLNTSFYAIFIFVESDVFYCVIICNFLFLLSLCCTSFSLLMSISQSLCQFFYCQSFLLKITFKFFVILFWNVCFLFLFSSAMLFNLILLNLCKPLDCMSCFLPLRAINKCFPVSKACFPWLKG
jgi:hypothetical protein